MKPRILIVEDDREMAEMLRVTLSPAFDVDVCTEKAHAIDEAREYLTHYGEPDAMVIDLIINGEGGIDLYNWMHEKGYYPPVIFLTGCHQQSPEFVAAQETGEQIYEKENFSSMQLAQYLTEMVVDKAS